MADESVLRARLDVSMAEADEPALRVGDTVDRFRRYSIVGAAYLAVGLLASVVGGWWVVNEITEPTYSYQRTTVTQSDPSCPTAGSLASPTPTLSVCLDTSEQMVRSKNTPNVVAFWVAPLGVALLVAGVLLTRRAWRWRAVAATTPWRQASVEALRIERREPWLMAVRLDDDALGLMRFSATSSRRARQLSPGAADALTDGDGNWLMWVGSSATPFQLREARTADELLDWQSWGAFSRRAARSSRAHGDDHRPIRDPGFYGQGD